MSISSSDNNRKLHKYINDTLAKDVSNIFITIVHEHVVIPVSHRLRAAFYYIIADINIVILYVCTVEKKNLLCMKVCCLNGTLNLQCNT